MQSPPLWRFGPFEADAAEHQLRREGEIVPITRKSFALLAALLGRPGKLFTKAELFESVWAGSIVTDAALSRAIRELRVALDDDASAPRYIATAHGLGFRFVALVSQERPAADLPAQGAEIEQRLVGLDSEQASRALVARAPATRFFGRDHELATLAKELGDHRRRLVTIVGPPGVGKTRLALQFATSWSGPSTPVFVSLESLDAHLCESTSDMRESALVSRIGAALGVDLHSASDPAAGLIATLNEEASLLVFDNFEHRLGDAWLLDRLLHETPTSMVVTSRVRLGLAAEMLLPLGGLDADAEDGGDALRLFVDRAGLPTALPAATLLQVKRICALAAGQPLALELSARQSRHVSLQEIAQRLASDLDAIHSDAADLAPRQRSLAAAFEGSWRLLGAERQRALARLSVLRGHFDRALAEAVLGASSPAERRAVEATLAELGASSLLSHDAVSGRHAWHPFVREFAALRLAHWPDEERAAHGGLGRHVVETLDRWQLTEDRASPAALAWVKAEFDHLITAWRHALAEPRIQWWETLAEAIALHCEIHGRYEDGARLLAEAGRRTAGSAGGAPDVGDLQAARVAVLRARLQHWLEGQAARDTIDAALLVVARHDDLVGRIGCLRVLGLIAWRSGDGKLAAREFSAALTLSEAHGRSEKRAILLDGLGLAYAYLGLAEESMCCFQEALDLNEREGNPFQAVQNLINLSLGKRVAHPHEALALAQRAIELANRIDYRHYVPHGLCTLALAQLALGDGATAAGHAREAAELGRRSGDGYLESWALLTSAQALIASHRNAQGSVDLQRGLELAWDLDDIPLVLAHLAASAELAARDGDEAWAAHLRSGLREHPGLPGDALDATGVPMPPRRARPGALSELVQSALGWLGSHGSPAAPGSADAAHGPEPSFATPLSGPNPAQATKALAVSDKPPLVGREDALARLGEALGDARAGRRRVVFVTGEAGIGKTALVEAVLERHAAGTALCVAQGRCIEQYGTGEAYLPILEALEQLAGQIGNDRFRDVLARYAPTWLAQLPWLGDGKDPATLQPAPADTGGHRLLRELAHALDVLAADRPIVLWLEDLHWSDPSSLAVVDFLAGRREPARLLLLGSFRPADAHSADSPLHGLSLRLLQRGQASEVALDLLDLADVTTYVGLRLDNLPPALVHELGAFVHHRTDGNALFTVATIDDLVRRGKLLQSSGVWSVPGGVAALGDGLPDDLRHLVHEQIDRLAEHDRRLVEAAAITGTDFSAAAVAAALDTDVIDVEDRCARLAQHGRLLRSRAPVPWPDGTVASGFGFRHALFWQGAHERVPEHRRAEWQRRIATAQEKAFGSQCTLIASELAMRFEAARDFDRSLRYLQMAAAGALSRFAYAECIGLVRRGLEELLPQLPKEQQPARELQLRLPLGAALMGSQGYASDDVDANYRRALALCADHAGPGDLERVLRGLWNVSFLRADLAGARAAAEKELLEADAASDALRVVDASTKLGQTLMHLGALAEARKHLERAIAVPHPRDVVRQRERPRVAAYLAWVLWFSGQPTDAMCRAEEALALGPAVGSQHSRAFALGFASWLHFLRGEVPESRRLAQQQWQVSSEHGLTYWRLWAEFMDGMCQVPLGEPLQGVGAMQHSLGEMRAAGWKVGIPHFLCTLAEGQIAAGHYAAAREALADAHGLVASNGNALYAAEGFRLQGELALAEAGSPAADEQAERSFLSALDVARRQGARALELRAATSLARLWTEHGDVARATQLLAPVHAAFTQGFDTADLRSAASLLEAMAEPSRGAG